MQRQVNSICRKETTDETIPPAVTAMPFTLRLYQSTAIRDTYRLFRAGKRRVLLAAATGTGKTEMAGQKIADLLSRGGRCLFVVDRLELCDQTARRFIDRFGFPSAVCQGDHELSNPEAPVQVATWQTLTRRRKWLETWMAERPGSSVLIIWDEAHETAWTTFAREYLLPKTAERKDVYHIMLTATPYRLSKTEGMGDICDDIVSCLTPGQAMAQGFLVHDRYLPVPLEADLDTLPIQAGDFEQSALASIMASAPSIAAAVQAWERHTRGRQTIAYAVNVMHATALCAAFVKAGHRAAVISGDTPKAEREQALSDLEAHRIDVLCNCAIAIKGLDIPAVSCILYSRPTRSAGLWFQAIGRGFRLAPGKVDCIVLDQGECVSRLGKARDLPVYQLETGEQKKKRIGEGGDELKPPEPWKCDHCPKQNPISQNACLGCGERRPKESSKPKIDPPESGYACAIGGKIRNIPALVVFASAAKGDGQWVVLSLRHPVDGQRYTLAAITGASCEARYARNDRVLVSGVVSQNEVGPKGPRSRLVKLKLESVNEPVPA